MKKQLPIRKEFKYNHNMGTPFVIDFVYPRNGSGYIVKGPRTDVDKWLEKNAEHPCLVHETWWQNGRHRAWYRVYGLRPECRFYLSDLRMVQLDDPQVSSLQAWEAYKAGAKTGWRHVMLAWKNIGLQQAELKKYVRRPPRRWIKELDEFC